MKRFAIIALLLLPLAAFAQQEDPAEKEKQEKLLLESVDKEVDRLTDLLDLEDWQVFYVDSIMTHDYKAMMGELEDLNKSKVSNVDLFIMAQDKWKEAIYVAFEKVFDEAQWEKYNKNGASKEKKARDKRNAKRNK